MSNVRIDHKCNCFNQLPVTVEGDGNVYHKECEGFIGTTDEIINAPYSPHAFMNFKKYNIGDAVIIKDAVYFVDSVYDDGVAEVLICDCDTNCKDNNGYPTKTCFNCNADRIRLDDDEDGNADWEWVNGFSDKMTIVNEPEIKIRHLSKLNSLKVRLA